MMLPTLQEKPKFKTGTWDHMINYPETDVSISGHYRPSLGI